MSVFGNLSSKSKFHRKFLATNHRPGNSRDRGINDMARVPFDPDPAGAVNWAATIGDQSLRQGTLEMGSRTWNDRDHNSLMTEPADVAFITPLTWISPLLMVTIFGAPAESLANVRKINSGCSTRSVVISARI